MNINGLANFVSQNDFLMSRTMPLCWRRISTADGCWLVHAHAILLPSLNLIFAPFSLINLLLCDVACCWWKEVAPSVQHFTSRRQMRFYNRTFMTLPTNKELIFQIKCAHNMLHHRAPAMFIFSSPRSIIAFVYIHLFWQITYYGTHSISYINKKSKEPLKIYRFWDAINLFKLMYLFSRIPTVFRMAHLFHYEI